MTEPTSIVLEQNRSRRDGAKAPCELPLCKLGLRPFPVFVLFRPVIDGNPGRAAGRRSRAFPVVILELMGKPQAPVVPGLLFFSCCLQENRGTEWVEPRARSLIAASCLAMLAAVRGDDGVHKPPGRRGGYP
jgi:hypothetical protein